ncbi:MAG: hypothetical protein P1U72_04335 [Paracoccaceae bacterium]|nr:hypothetical protein [Paracoccaceae bacterium]
MYHKTFLSFLAIATLSACGGSSTGSASFETSEQAFDERLANAQALVDKYEDASATIDMPTSGTASYTGFAAFAETEDFEEEDVFAIADVSMTANFTATGGSISGSMTNFLAFPEDDGAVESIGGSLAIANADFTGSTFSTTVSGTLTDPEGSVTFTGNMTGQFVGSAGGAIRAGLEMLDTEDNYGFYGGIIAEKN